MYQGYWVSEGYHIAREVYHSEGTGEPEIVQVKGERVWRIGDPYSYPCIDFAWDNPWEPLNIETAEECEGEL